MFGLFKSKKTVETEAKVDGIGMMLFEQISTVIKKVNDGRIDIDKATYDQRRNSMFSAGYLIGYVDEYLSELFTDDRSKSKYAQQIYEGISPGHGVTFVQSKLSERRAGERVSPDSDDYVDVFIACQEFDAGIAAGRYEVGKYLEKTGYSPNKLECYLATEVI